MTEDDNAKGYKVIGFTTSSNTIRHSDGKEETPERVTAAKDFDGRDEKDLDTKKFIRDEYMKDLRIDDDDVDEIVLKKHLVDDGKQKSILATYNKIMPISDTGDSVVKSRVVTIVVEEVTNSTNDNNQAAPGEAEED